MQRKLKSMTFQEKIRIIETIESGKTVTQLSSELGTSKNTLHFIYKNKDRIRAEISNQPNMLNKMRIKQIKCPDLETKVLNWMYETKMRNEKVTGSQLKAMALEIANSIGYDEFLGSNGWLFSFLKRHEINLRDFNGDNDSSIQLIKIERALDKSEVSQGIIESIQEPQEQSEYEQLEEVVNYTAEWKNWCRLCCDRAATDFHPNLNEAVYRIFGIEHDIRICDECRLKIQEIDQLMCKEKNVENLFRELEDLENQKNNLNDEMVLGIRTEYGFDIGEEVIYEDNSIAKSESEHNEIIEEFIVDELEEQSQDIDVSENQEFIYVGKDDEMVEEEVEELESSAVVSTSRVDESEYDFTCHICNETFERMFILTNHTREMHACLPQVACITCGKYLATWDTLLGHRRKHSLEEANFECDVCSAKFASQVGLSIHASIKHNKKSQRQSSEKNICKICNKEFRDASILKSHCRVHLPEKERLPFQCEICDKRLSNKYSLQHHILSVHEKSKTITCHLCPKTFSNKSNLRSHLISHTTENVKCPVCDLTFKNRISLQSHKKLHRENSRNFSCSVCGKMFFNRCHLDRHRISHTEVRNFKCTYAGCEHIAYKWEKDLKSHLLTHQEVQEQVLDCQYCELKFTTENKLKKHTATAHYTTHTIQEEENY